MRDHYLIEHTEKRGPVTITVATMPEDTPVRGNVLASGDDAIDRACEDEILARLDLGEYWAWCIVRVRASIEVNGRTFSGDDCLGGCSYSDCTDFMHPDGYFPDMVGRALDDLRGNVERLANPKPDPDAIVALNLLRKG